MSINTPERGINCRSMRTLEARAEGAGQPSPRRFLMPGALRRRSAVMAATALSVFALTSAQAQTSDDQSRMSSLTCYAAAEGALNGLLKTETVEPGDATSPTEPNSLTTNWILDDFGRAVMEPRADGKRTVSHYSCQGTGTPSPMSPAALSAILQLLLDD